MNYDVARFHRSLDVAQRSGISIRRVIAGRVYDDARRMMLRRLSYTRRILDRRGVPRYMVQNVSSRDRDVTLLRGVVRRCRMMLV